MFEPSVQKILQYLQAYPGVQTTAEIIQATGEKPEHVGKALTKLVQEKMVIGRQGKYRYAGKRESDTLLCDLMDVCVLVNRCSQMELLARSLLCSTPQPSLIRVAAVLDILTTEGYSSEEAAGFIDEEIQRGYVKKIRLLFWGRRIHSMPTYVPQDYISPLSWVDVDSYHHVGHHSKEEGQDVPSVKEDYMIGNYSREMANQAREYLETEKPYIKEKLSEEAMRDWYFWLI